MAGAAAAAAAAISAAATPLPPPTTVNSRISSSSLPSSFPPRQQRTNHLRKKILKTLENKPYPDPHKTLTLIETTQHQQQQQQFSGFSESTHVSTSESPGFFDDILGTFSTKSFAKIGLWLVGAFVFQTVCAVLIFGLNDLDDKDDTLNDHSDHDQKKEKVSKSKLRSDFLVSGNRNASETKEGGMVLVDEFEMENRIMEIKEMARRAREQEKTERKRNGLVDEENDGVDFDLIERSVKKKEVDDRLMKVKDRLEGEYKKPETKTRRTEGGDVGHDSLMFKKKYKYKNPSVESGDKPKGFSGVKDVNAANGSVINGISVDDGMLQIDKKNGGASSNDVRSGSDVSVSKDENKEHEHRATKTESIAGTTKDLKHDKQTNKADKSGKSNSLETKKPRGFGKESNDTATTTKHDDLVKNGSLKSKRGGNKKSARSQTEFWWTRLPYVMAVEMQSGGDIEESSGLFTIRNPTGLSHTVAFEDPSDATNFCYLLESFFEGLNGFSTCIIPIPTNELEKEVRSQILKVIVVKKGQLKLYIGQPLEDVESALRLLIEQEGDS